MVEVVIDIESFRDFSLWWGCCKKRMLREIDDYINESIELLSFLLERIFF